jgi:hypothetical protein
MSDLSAFGKVAVYTGMIKRYKNGSAQDFIWRWYNPLVWVLVPIIIVGGCLILGAIQILEDLHGWGLCMHPYFKDKEVEWL